VRADRSNPAHRWAPRGRVSARPRAGPSRIVAGSLQQSPRSRGRGSSAGCARRRRRREGVRGGNAGNNGRGVLSIGERPRSPPPPRQPPSGRTAFRGTCAPNSLVMRASMGGPCPVPPGHAGNVGQ
jgi:hypothetical protein